jgi:sugar/nucleoside kinase (ribokinase family)
VTLLVTGWVALDDIETPFGKVEGSLGGSATCAALTAALFTPVRLLAAVGEDFPPKLAQRLARPNIDTAGLVRVEGARTSRWGAKYHHDMNTRDTWYPELGISVEWKPRLPDEWRDTTSACLAAGHPEDQNALLQALDRPKATLVDTIKMFIDETPDELRETMRLADFVVVNESEARMLTGRPSIAQAARSLLADGVKHAIIKLGEYGAVFATEGEYFVVPGYPLEDLVDPTGAGDAFAGGLMGYLDSVPAITPGEIRRALVYASTVASFCVEGFGPSRLLQLTRAEVDARYREFRALTHFEAGE